jgi:hypothetical protein
MDDPLLSKTDELQNTKAKRIRMDFQRAEAISIPWDQVHERVYEYVIPERHTEWSQEPDALYSQVWDSTPVEAAQSLSNTLASGLTPVWTPWFQLVPGPLVKDDERAELREALHIVNQILFLHLNLSNFTPQIQSTFLDLTVGTGAISIQPHRRGRGVEFSNIPIEQLSILRDSADDVTHIFRKRKLKALDILVNDDYLKKLRPEKVTELEKDITKDHIVIEAIIRSKNAKKWSYDLMLLGGDDQGSGDVILDERSFGRQPIKVGRWNTVPGQPFGRGPAMLAFGDIRLLNKVKELGMKNLAKAVAGIYTVLDDGIVNPRNIQLRGGALIPVGSNDRGNPTIKELERSGQTELLQFALGDLRESIRRAFFADQFSPTIGTKMSALEISERGRVISQSLGATYASVQHDILIPLLNDMIEILQKQDELPKGFKIDREEIDVMFISSIANSQRYAEVEAMMQFAQFTMQLQQLDPRAAVVLNAEEYQRRIAELLAVDEAMLRSAEEVEETTQQAVEGMAAMQGGGEGAGQQPTDGLPIG